MTDEILSVINGQVYGVWFLIGAALVFWMQAGFAMVEYWKRNPITYRLSTGGRFFAV
ncbi:MAG: hypothetical protein UET88_03590 [Lachnospiraceae bacterium]|nr:hypothetical protein [Lachnospiraceae bacterium]